MAKKLTGLVTGTMLSNISAKKYQIHDAANSRLGILIQADRACNKIHFPRVDLGSSLFMASPNSPSDQDQPKRRATFLANGVAITNLRMKIGFTQEALADATQLSERVIRKLESGQRVNGNTLQVIRDWFAAQGQLVTLDELIQPLATDSKLSREQAVEFARQWFEEILTERNWKLIATLVAPQSLLLVDGQSFASADQLAKHLQQTTASRYEIERVLVDENWLVVKWNCTHAPSTTQEQQPNLQGISALHINGSQLAHLRQHSSPLR